MFSERISILVVDDEPSVVDMLADGLGEEGYRCITASTGEEGLKRLARKKVDAMLLDLSLPGISGMDVLKETAAKYPGVAVIVVTAAGDAQTVVEAMKLGAADYITKPFELEKVNSSLEAVIKQRAVADEQAGEASGAKSGWMRYLDDIANGVEARLDSLTGYVMTMAVIDKTAAVARSLDIPDDQVKQWADARRKGIDRVENLEHFLQTVWPGPVSRKGGRHGRSTLA